MTAARLLLHARKAAAMGLTPAAFQAYCAAETRRIDAINRYRHDHAACIAAIARHAAAQGRTWSVWS